MAVPTTSPLPALLTKIKAKLVSALGIASDRVLLVLDERVPKFQGDQDILLEPGPVQPEPNMDQAAGRAYPLVYRVLRATLRTRFGVDLSDRSDYWISDTARGHFAFEEALLGALNNYQPEDANKNVLLQEPMHWLPSDKPRQDKRDKTWGEAVMSFSLLYELSMLREASQ
jgi:hypothetical protein